MQMPQVEFHSACSSLTAPLMRDVEQSQLLLSMGNAQVHLLVEISFQGCGQQNRKKNIQ